MMCWMAHQADVDQFVTYFVYALFVTLRLYAAARIVLLGAHLARQPWIVFVTEGMDPADMHILIERTRYRRLLKEGGPDTLMLRQRVERLFDRGVSSRGYPLISFDEDDE